MYIFICRYDYFFGEGDKPYQFCIHSRKKWQFIYFSEHLWEVDILVCVTLKSFLDEFRESLFILSHHFSCFFVQGVIWVGFLKKVGRLSKISYIVKDNKYVQSIKCSSNYNSLEEIFATQNSIVSH